ncbi:MAG: hypothetical protein EHM48_08865 [Planctomycetaceae bacterium]|nr:MAG: hypothetical protein EHM48_08865 [Planctomycetaceae bacterium]
MSSGFFNSIGIDVDMYFNLGSQLGGGPAGGGPNYTVDPFTGAHVPIKGTSGWGDGKPGSNEVTPIGVITNGGTLAPGFGSMLGVAGPPGSIANQISSPGLQVQGVFLDDVQVDFIIQATQASSTTRTLTAPRLTLFNGQQAYVSVGQQRAYVSSFTPVVTENTSALVPSVSTVLDGTMLQVQATVSADKRYVTLTVQPQVSRVDSIDTFSLGVGQGTLQLPRVTQQEVRTTVSVPDGGTLLLGGMRTSNEAEREGGVPILSKIPVIERLFTNRGKVRDEQTLLILIKPKIIIQREQENDAFPPHR